MTSSGSRDRDIAIVGVAESDEMGTVPNKSSLQHHAEAVLRLQTQKVEATLLRYPEVLGVANYHPEVQRHNPSSSPPV